MLQERHQIPIGPKFCFPHLKKENNEKNKWKDSSTPSTRKDTTNLMHESCMEPDVDFVPDVLYGHVHETLVDFWENIAKLTDVNFLPFLKFLH